jgi:hypothetical protein
LVKINATQTRIPVSRGRDWFFAQAMARDSNSAQAVLSSGSAAVSFRRAAPDQGLCSLPVAHNDISHPKSIEFLVENTLPTPDRNQLILIEKRPAQIAVVDSDASIRSSVALMWAMRRFVRMVKLARLSEPMPAKGTMSGCSHQN